GVQRALDIAGRAAGRPLVVPGHNRVEQLAAGLRVGVVDAAAGVGGRAVTRDRAVDDLRRPGEGDAAASDTGGVAGEGAVAQRQRAQPVLEAAAVAGGG